ncbi:putative porin [Paraburkholderia caballeronis]|uniref:porin n=1 Tax=Paraburkholderia caballeronis TaxID=416943 RepID=UPI0010649A3B|nr:porin [Paraburkholderia caballeronis]TDV39074.1 putative porin [Paraburkholderia caballeronis]
MKRVFLALTAVSLAPVIAHAQSSVTLYGVLTGNVTYLNNAQTAATTPGGRPRGGTQVAVLDGGTSGPSASRWGLKGIEDLGGGLKAIFNVEGGFSINNGAIGQGGTLFGRQAWVGLSANRYGTVTLGRQSDLAVDYVSPLLYAWYFGNMAIHPSDYDNLNFTHRINNAVKYASDSFGGFRFGALYSFGGVAGNVSQNQYWSTGVSYTGGSFALAASIINARNPNTSLYGTNANASATGNNLGSQGSATSPETSPSIAGFASARTQQTVSVASTYTLGSAIFGAVWSNTQFRNLGYTASLNPLNYSGNASFNTVGVSVRYQVTPFLRVGTSFDYTDGGNVSGKGSAKYGQLNVGAGYSLSKATELYLSAAYQHASGVDSWGRPAVADIGYLTPSATSKQVALSLGVKHLF